MITKEQLDEYTKAYSRGEKLISDEEYDQLLEEYLSQNGEENRPFLRSKQSDATARLVCTLHKVYGVTEPMRPGQKTYEQWIQTKGFNPIMKIIIQNKYDGCSVACDRFGKFFTRGDYDNGESVDVTDLFGPYFNQSFHETVDGVKFEAIMSRENFNNLGLNETYNCPRDAVAAIITSRNTELSKYITLVPLRELVGDQEFVCDALRKTSSESTVDDFDAIQRFINDRLSNGVKVSIPVNNSDQFMTFDIDGVVVTVLDASGETYDEIAIKIINDVKEAKLIDVEFQFGKTGKITPVAIIEPTLFADGQRTVDHIGLSTIGRVKDMNLRRNDTVRVMYNIVPYMIDSNHDGDIPINTPTKCPICGHDLVASSAWKTVRCGNYDCPGIQTGAITRYATVMKMFGISESTINRFFDAGIVTKISDLYHLNIDTITRLPGFKETSAANIVRSIDKASTDVPVSRWLGALPFKDVSTKKWDILLNSLLGNDEMIKSNWLRELINNGDSSDFSNVLITADVPGLGMATRKAMNDGWMRNLPEMKEIIKYITFRITTVITGDRGNVTFTGCRDEQLSEELRSIGYNITDFNSKTDVLIIPYEGYSNNKTAKAIKMGIKIYTIDTVIDGALK